VDTALLGHLSNVAFLGALSVAGVLFNIIFWGFGFLRMGTTGLTAQAYGKKDHTASIMTLGRALTVAAGISVLILGLQIVIANLGFAVIGASAEVEHYARIYFFIRIYSTPATLGLFAINGWFLGMQNARYPMIVTVVLNILNILLDAWFVFGLHMNVKGVALGTLISSYVGFVLAGVLLCFRYMKHLRAFQLQKLLHLSPLKKFFSVNRDIFLRTLCLVFTFTFFTSVSASLGDVTLAANTILLQLWMIVSYGIDGFAFAAESLVGRFTGSSQPGKLKQTVKYCFLWGMGIGAAGSFIYGFFDVFILKIFTNQQAVISAGLTVIGWTIAAPLVNSACYIWDGVFTGATVTAPMRNNMFTATALVFVPAYYISHIFWGNNAIWLAMILFMAARGIGLSILAPKYILKKGILMRT
jgi:MATE family multidrug resistance protein